MSKGETVSVCVVKIPSKAMSHRGTGTLPVCVFLFFSFLFLFLFLLLSFRVYFTSPQGNKRSSPFLCSWHVTVKQAYQFPDAELPNILYSITCLIPLFNTKLVHIDIYIYILVNNAKEYVPFLFSTYTA